MVFYMVSNEFETILDADTIQPLLPCYMVLNLIKLLFYKEMPCGIVVLFLNGIKALNRDKIHADR